jgi:NodT family efflux transporter outer membrane factor (OMF) lipoprotein
MPPLTWRTAIGPGSSIDADWWQYFHDPALSAVVKTALVGNVDIALAAARVSEARAQEHSVRAQLVPVLNLGGGIDRSRYVNAFGRPSTSTDGAFEFTVSYELDLFGKLANADAAARAGLLANEAAQGNVRLAVAAGAAGGYIALRALDARLIVVREALEARKDSLNIARRRAETGYGSTLEMRQAEAEYHAAEQLVPVLELAVTRQENALSILIGLEPHFIPRGSPLDDIAAPVVPPGLPAELLRRRPDITRAEEELVGADHSLDSARAAFLPSVGLTGSAGVLFSSLLSNPITIWSLGGSVLAPIFNGGEIAAAADAAAARRDQAAFAYRKTALVAFREVEDALTSVQRANEQAVALQQQRDALAEALRHATNRYRAGYSPYLDQLDAQRGLLNADLALIQARADALEATVTLYQALGGGWQTPDTKKGTSPWAL